MRKILTVIALGLSLAACGSLTAPPPQPSAAVVSTVQNDFAVADMALVAVSMDPNVSPTIVAEAKVLEADLKAAWTQYTTNPASTNQAEALQLAITAAQNYLAAQPVK